MSPGREAFVLMEYDLRPSESKAVSDGSRRVLIADDDSAVRVLVTTVLRRRGYEIDSVSNGLEAIHKIAVEDYAAILLDLMMPEADGYVVIAHLERTAPRVLSDSVIVLTAVSNADLRRLEGKAIFRIIRKPFDLEELAAAVADSARGRELARVDTALS